MMQKSRYTVNRVAWLILAIIVMGVSNGFLVKLDLGQNPCGGFCLGLSRLSGIGLGSVMLLVNGLLLMIVTRFDRSQIGLGMLLNMVCVGYITDFSVWFCGKYLPAGLFMATVNRYLLLLPVLLAFTVSVGIYLAVELGEAPYDAIPVILGKCQQKFSYRTVRLLWDLAFVLGGTLLGVRLGIVTALLGFLLAPVITMVASYFEPLLEKSE